MDQRANERGAKAAERAGEGAPTPMMAQYLEIKAANPDCLLFYRMGDFYELFFEDAEAASRALGIALTKRGKHLGEDIAMCGVPVHTADDYLARLIAAGFRVAVCEQLEDPKEAKKRGSKAVVKRDVVRLVTAGTITEESLLDGARSNWLMALARLGPGEDAVYGLAWADISTGAFRVSETGQAGLSAEIARIEPREIVLADQIYEEAALRPVWTGSGAVLAPLPRAHFEAGEAPRRLARYFGVETVDGFGAFSRAEMTAAAALTTYIERTQLAERPPLSPPVAEGRGGLMTLDAATRANLELTRTLSGERRGSVLAAIDRTVTPAGCRLLAERLAGPLTDPAAIAERHDGLGALVDDPALRRALREALKSAPDIARACSRIALQRGGPRDLGAIRAGLDAAARLAGRLGAVPEAPKHLAELGRELGSVDPALPAALSDALAEDLPMRAHDGGFVRAGHRADLDETRALRDESRRVIAALQARYAEETGIRALKVRHNAVLGYFVEVSAANAERLTKPPLADTFIHRQTMAGAMRFSTVELGEIERRLASAADEALALELAVFRNLSAAVTNEAAGLKRVGEALAALDVAAGLAELSAMRGWVRPLVDAGLAFAVESGRHPVVEEALAADKGPPFVANDCDLSAGEADDAGRIWLLTGPNMAGKSTFLRQNALIAILAQMGAHVPAARAHIGVVDRLFSRVGAADDLARGRSTFMVEMVETAAILNQAGPRALVILDEIGRGTATFDGLSIAWAAIEHLHETNRSRALFATHYHELTALSARLSRLVNATIRVKEWEGEVVFLHEVVPGAADRSYGIQVAKLAGLPAPVVARARQVLDALEADERSGEPAALIDDLPLFRVASKPVPPPAPPAEPDPLIRLVDGLDPDATSPREALDILYRLKDARRGGG